MIFDSSVWMSFKDIEMLSEENGNQKVKCLSKDWNKILSSEGYEVMNLIVRKKLE